ncbi:hypothetical protein P4E94_16705 [Pontiellaceae bacterium B12219]|nr:hypothetical protein [Pontiellaceae bacterium B12219]
MKQSTGGKYNYPLKVELFAIGSEIGANQFILLDRAAASFVPSEFERGTAFEFSGRTVDLLDYDVYEMRRGDRYDGFLITVTDERGEVIAHRSTPSWLIEHWDRLADLPVGSFMDKTCTRVWPTPLRPQH